MPRSPDLHLRAGQLMLATDVPPLTLRRFPEGLDAHSWLIYQTLPLSPQEQADSADMQQLLKTADGLLMQTDLFGQRGTTRTRTEETFEGVIDAVLKEKFSGDKSHYSEAMQVARERRPDLMNEYLSQPRGNSR